MLYEIRQTIQDKKRFIEKLERLHEEVKADKFKLKELEDDLIGRG